MNETRSFVSDELAHPRIGNRSEILGTSRSIDRQRAKGIHKFAVLLFFLDIASGDITMGGRFSL